MLGGLAHVIEYDHLHMPSTAHMTVVCAVPAELRSLTLMAPTPTLRICRILDRPLEDAPRLDS